jgi:hypothetical protein
MTAQEFELVSGRCWAAGEEFDQQLSELQLSPLTRSVQLLRGLWKDLPLQAMAPDQPGMMFVKSGLKM